MSLICQFPILGVEVPLINSLIKPTHLPGVGGVVGDLIDKCINYLSSLVQKGGGWELSAITGHARTGKSTNYSPNCTRKCVITTVIIL